MRWLTGAAGSSAEWLLFTDADTFHYPGSLAAAVGEAETRKVDLLSYSPEQETARMVGTGGDAAGFCRSRADVFFGKNQ